MKLKRFVAIVISLAMVLSIVPAFSLTASAESLAADAELVFDGAFGVGASTYSVEFTMGGSSFGYKDTGMVDTVGNYIGGFCYAGPTDGFYPADGERSVGLSSGFSQTSDTGGSTTWTSGSSRMNITFNILTDSTYEVVYTCDGTYVATVTYSGSPVGITHPLAWKGTGWGSASPAYDNVVITVDGETVYDESNLPDLATASDWYAIEFTLSTGRDGATSGYRDWQIKDADGNQFTGFCFAGTTDGFYPGDRQSLSSGFSLTSTNSDTSTTWTSMSTKMRVAVTKGDGTYTVTYTKIESDTETELSSFTYSGTPNGITLPYEWATTGGSGTFTFANVQVYAVVPEATKDITATYTAGGTTVKTQTKTIDTSVTDSASFDEYYYSVNGTNTLYYAAAQTLGESATIEMTALDNWSEYAVGDSVTVDSTPYAVKSTNLIPNGNFTYGKNGWYTGISTAMADGFSLNGDGTAKGINNNGTAGASSVWRAWATEAGKTYLLTFDSTVTSGYYVVSEKADLTATSDGTVVTTAVAGTNTKIYTATQPYLLASFRWMNGASVGNFGLYEVEVDSSKIANTTIKFVDSSDNTTEIATAVTITGIVGDVIDLSAYTGAITYNGNPYSFDSTNPTSYTVVSNNDEVTLTYTTDAYVSFTADAVTVIEGNDPIMPTTVTAVTGAGSETVVSGAVWTGYTGLSAGTHEVSGTVTIDGTTVSGSTTVTVLEETFSVSDATSNTWMSFPVNVTGDFYVEFEMNASNLDNNWIYISADQALWGSGQIGLGWDANGNGYFRAQPAAQTDVQFATGKTYRFLVHGNVDTDTYDLTVYDTETNTVITTADDYAFRTGSDYVNGIYITSNGEGGVFTLSNVKVYAPDQASSFAEYTYTVEGAGDNNGTFTTKATSAEGVEIPYFEGYILKTREVDGTTLTYTYEATEASLGSWVTRNNVTENTWLTEMKYLGSHDSFTDKIKNDSSLVDAAGVTYGDSGAKAAKNYLSTYGSTIVNVSKAQSADALTQLNAGVRYFDVRLSRQADGVFWTRHGLLSEQFRGIATTIAQFAAENPGEVILLDFQSTFDGMYGDTYDVVTGDTSYYGETAGDDNKYVYDALIELLTETGVMDYVPSSWDAKWGALTNNGEKSVILLFAKARGANCNSKFINRSSYTSNTTTYAEDDNYDDVVSTIDSTYTSIGSGANFGIIHAYSTTAISLSTLMSGGSLIDDANENNPNWINEDNFDAWMGRGVGDIIIMDDVISDASTYIAKMAEYNRDGTDATYGNEHESANGKTVNGVTMTGATSSIPFSTEFTVDATAVEQTITVDGVDYTTKTAYSINLMQFDTNAVQPTGDVTLTFPQVSDGSTTVDVLFYNDAVVATAGVGEAISYTTSKTGNFVLATKAAPGVNLTVQYVADGTVVNEYSGYYAYGVEVYNVPEGDFYIAYNGKAYIVNSSAAQAYASTEGDYADGATVTVELTMVSENAVLEDMLVDSDNNVWGINATNTNSIFVAAAGDDRNGPGYDDDGVSVTDEGVNPSKLGSNRNGYLQFPVVDLADGQAAIANFYVRTWHGNTFSNENTTIRLSATAINDDSWTTLTDGATYTDTAAPQFEGYTATMFSSKSTNTAGYITFDVTEMMKAAKTAGLSTITMRLGTAWGAAYIVEREAAVAGGSYAGKASYIDVVDANTVTIPDGATKVTKNGTDVTAYLADNTLAVPATSTIKITMPAAADQKDAIVAYVDAGYNVYKAGEAFSPVEGEVAAVSFGFDMVEGAQVRIGDGVNESGKVDGTNSGLRFITQVNGTDTLAGFVFDEEVTNEALKNATYGVRITAEGSDTVKEVPATKWQTEGEVFTTALTNLAVSNYNRKFTATPYVTINGETFTGTPITRSMYQVAAGLLVNNSSDNTEYGDGALAAQSMIDVLNAYVNQTGIRLQMNSEGLEIYNVENSTSNYSGDVFFTVESTSVVDNVYTITIKPAGANTVIKDYWQEYIRINNNNSAIKGYTSLANNEDGSVTITFDYAQYLADNTTAE